MIKTSRLMIQPYDILDKNPMIELLKNPIIKQNYVIPDFSSTKECEEYFLKLLRYSHSLKHYERGIYLNQHLIGFVNDVNIENKKIEIGYVIHPEYHQQGYATEMLEAVIIDLFNNGYEEIICCAFESNKASFRVMEKCHMKPMNKVADFSHQDKIQKVIYYSIKNISN